MGADAARHPASALSGLIADALAACGLPPADAAVVAELMTEADLTGADAHGIFRLPQYVRRIHAGGINVRPAIVANRTGPATALVEGDNGMGHLVMRRAAETAVELARESGVGWVGARRSNHAGPAALYAEIPVKSGMVGLYSAVASSNHMAVWGGVEQLLGTNPLAIGVPCGDRAPVILDVATTVVSYGTIKKHALRGEPMPEGWMVSRADGRPIVDPKRAGEGMLLPIGGYKGSGLALVLGLLAGTLNGAAFGRDVVDFNADDGTETNTGHFVIAADVSRFLPPDVFHTEANRHLDAFRASEPLSPDAPVRLPGDERARRRAERTANGVPLPQALVAQLDALAGTLGVAPLGERGRSASAA